ncbi:MAG: zf-HC2 domain-containing protein [Phycisphaerales bacterium]|nr:zf-HC2 domain-containing protein [Phycisphaerales bacterium]
MMTCKEVLDFLMAYIDNELPTDQRDDFDRHLKVCPSCVNYMKSYRETVRLSRESALPAAGEVECEGSVPAEMIEAVRHAIRHAAAREKK